VQQGGVGIVQGGGVGNVGSGGVGIQHGKLFGHSQIECV
jgi:hypothetical protein